jgi:hypothetical protein
MTCPKGQAIAGGLSPDNGTLVLNDSEPGPSPNAWEIDVTRSGGERAWTGECRVFPAKRRDPVGQA